MEFFPFGLTKLGRGKEMDIPQEGVRVNKQQQPRSNRQIPPRQENNKASPSNSMAGMPGEQVWVEDAEAPASTKTSRGKDTFRLV